jgi:predicted dienelactone hydrolase
MIRRLLTLLPLLLLFGCGGDSADSDAATLPDAVPDAIADSAGDAAADADATAPRADFAWPPDAPGPYQTGHRQLEITYQPDGVTEPRTFKLALWYPTADTDGPSPTYLGIFSDDGAFEGASLAPPVVGSTYPLHVHSHGHGGYAGASPALFHHFASHGWVVAAPEHTGNTTLDLNTPRATAMYFLRGFDISAALDTLAALPASDPLAGHLDTSRVVMSGHSFGGYTAFAIAGAAFDTARIEADCEVDKGPGGPCTAAEIAVFRAGTRDPRVVAALPMAAGNRVMYGDAGYGQIAIPVLMLTGAADNDVPNATEGDPIFAALAGKDAARVDIAGGCHQVFGIGGCPGITDDEGFRIVNTYSLAFARARLLGDTSLSGILDGSTAVSASALWSPAPAAR